MRGHASSEAKAISSPRSGQSPITVTASGLRESRNRADQVTAALDLDKTANEQNGPVEATVVGESGGNGIPMGRM